MEYYLSMSEIGLFLGSHKEILILLTIWELIWKGLALWVAARNEHKVWFVAILILNTLGLLPILYLVLNKYKDKHNIEKILI